MAIDSKRIAKNTVFLFFRFSLILGVTFYVSRVLLDRLGVNEYGLYNVVFSIIGMLSFINGTLSTSTSRFITVELGRGDEKSLYTIFSTALFSHIVLAGIILVIAETLGLWYIYNVLVVPPERFSAVLIVYQISIIATLISIIQVPFTAEIMAHEHMQAYAYVGIFDAFARFAAAYAITFCSSDKLIVYAILLCLANFIVLSLNVIYSKTHFKEVKLNLHFDSKILKSTLKFSGWNILANLSNTIIIQGVIVLFNLFFSPALVAAQAIGNQISNGLSQFVANVRTAVNPQVIKLYADGSEKESERLTIISAEFVFYLLMLVGFPCILVMPKLLELWLVEVPDYTVIFARFLVFQLILENFNNAFYTPLLAANKISLNSILECAICILQFAILYVLFKCGVGPIWARYIGVVIVCVFSFIEKPLLLWRCVGFDIVDLYHTIGRCLAVMLAAIGLNYLLFILIPCDTISHSIFLCATSAVAVLLCSFMFMGKTVRNHILSIILHKKL